MSSDIVCEYLNGIKLSRGEVTGALRAYKAYVRSAFYSDHSWSNCHLIQTIRQHVEYVFSPNAQKALGGGGDNYFARDYAKYSLFIYTNEQINRMENFKRFADYNFREVYSASDIINNNMDAERPRLNILLLEWDKDFWESKRPSRTDLDEIAAYAAEKRKAAIDYLDKLSASNTAGESGKPVYDFSFLFSGETK